MVARYVDVGNPRYAVMEERYESLAREQIICGCHAHLGFGNRDLEILVLDRIRPWLPVLLALSANSPFWQGVDTGYASYRTQIFTRWPTAGMPPDLGSRAQYEAVVAQLVSAGAIADFQGIQWTLADCYSALYGASLARDHAANLVKQGKEFSMATSLAKKMAVEAARARGVSVHEWLDTVVKNSAKVDLERDSAGDVKART